MANGKSSFIFYCDWKHIFDELPDEYAGKLIKHMLAYVNDENPETEDIVLKATFAGIKNTLKRDLKKWEEEMGQKSTGGMKGNLKRWHPNLYKKVIKGVITVEEAMKIAYRSDTDNKGSHPIASIAVSVSDSVSVSDNELSVRKYAREMFEDETWLIAIRQAYPKLRNGENIKMALNQFVSVCHAKNKKHKDLNDCKAHFTDWMKYQKPEDIPGFK